MKQNRRDSKESHFVDPDFLEALEDNDPGNESSRRQVERKTHQFCRQVQRALNVAFADRPSELFDGLFVEEVSPAPDCGRLMVRVLVPEGLSIVGVMMALSQESPRLRSEVASAITRKRAPELCFVPVCSEGAGDE